MQDRQKSSFESYSNLSLNSDSRAKRAGRPEGSEVEEERIWRDIADKLRLTEGLNVLEIGVGSGYIAAQWLLEMKRLDFNLTLVDFPSVLDRLLLECRGTLANSENQLSLIDGIFPDTVLAKLYAKSYDRISIYSVIHYSNNPRGLIDAAIALLAPGGRMLVGDIPNLNKKGRFLSTHFGRAFDASYKGVNVRSIPIYKNHEDFKMIAIEEGAPLIDDAFVCNLILDYRKKGFDVYVHEQPKGLLMDYTREDLIICAPND